MWLCAAGKGVKATSYFQKGDFLIKYRGKLKAVADTFDLAATYIYTFFYRVKLCGMCEIFDFVFKLQIPLKTETVTGTSTL